MNGRTAIVAFAAMVTSTAVMGQTISKEKAAAQGTAMGTAYSIGAGLISSGIGAIGNAIKEAATGTKDAAPATTPAASEPNSLQAAAAAMAATKPPAPAAGVVAGSDEHYAHTPRASFEAAVEKAVAVLPEDRRADVKTKAMADYDTRVARYNSNRDLVNAALPIALDSVNSALRVSAAVVQPPQVEVAATPVATSDPTDQPAKPQ